MPTTLDCFLMRDLFGSARMRGVFDSHALLQSWLDVEVALAAAQAERGIIPVWAADAIDEAADARGFDLDAIRGEMATSQHPLVPALRALTERAGDAGQYVHWGATTQDILDTGLVLQIREALLILEATLDAITDNLAEIARQHRVTIMAARTHAQHAVPSTFGLKVAVWLDELDRARMRLPHLRGTLLVVQLGGAAGTMASLGDQALDVRAAVANRLGLGVRAAPWHVSRDGLAELAAWSASVAASLERIAREIVRLQSTEIGEVSEPLTDSHVGSSTMPQKRNPMVCEQVAAVCKLIRGLSPVMTGCMVVEHERDMAAWAAEWLLVPQLMIMLGGGLELLEPVTRDLVIDPERMRSNLELTDGALMAETAMLAMADAIGREHAHELMMRATREATRRGCSLREILRSMPEVLDVLGDRLDTLLRPDAYLGVAPDLVDSVVDAHERSRNGREHVAPSAGASSFAPGDQVG